MKSIVQRKNDMRRKLASLPIAEKLTMLGGRVMTQTGECTVYMGSNR